MRERARSVGGRLTVASAEGAGTTVTVCDINQQMLGEGVRRAEEKNESAIEWVCGNAESLSFPDNSFDAYTIACGIRNVTHFERALAELRGGRKRSHWMWFVFPQIAGLGRSGVPEPTGEDGTPLDFVIVATA